MGGGYEEEEELPDRGRERGAEGGQGVQVDTEIPGGWHFCEQTGRTKRAAGLAGEARLRSRLFDVPGCLPADTSGAVSG